MADVLRMWYLLPIQKSNVVVHRHGIDIEHHKNWFSIKIPEIKNVIQGKDVVFIEVNAMVYRKWINWRKS